MNDCRCSVLHVRQKVDDDGRHGITWRPAVVGVVVACILQAVLLACVCSYVRHELVTISSQVRQLMRDCRCRHPVVSVDGPSHAISPLQVNMGAGTVNQGKHNLLPCFADSACKMLVGFPSFLTDRLINQLIDFMYMRLLFPGESASRTYAGKVTTIQAAASGVMFLIHAISTKTV